MSLLSNLWGYVASATSSLAQSDSESSAQMNTSGGSNNGQISASKKKRNKKKNKNKAQATTSTNNNVIAPTNQSAQSTDNKNEETKTEENKQLEQPQIPPAPEMNLRSILGVIATQLNQKYGKRTSTKWKSAPTVPDDNDEDFDFGESFMDLFADVTEQKAPANKSAPAPKKKKKKKKNSNAGETQTPPPAPPLPPAIKKLGESKPAEEPEVNTPLPESLPTQTLLVKLLQYPQNSTYLRQAAMSLLNMYADDAQVSQEQQKLFETSVNIAQFINVNFVHGDQVTSQMASVILKRLAKNSTAICDAVVKCCISLLQNTHIVDHISSTASVERLADLVTSLSSEDITPIIIKHLEKLATRIIKVYTPQYTILRSKLGFDGLPFEQQLFEANANRPTTKPATGSLAAELDSPWATLTALDGDRVQAGKGNGHSKITELDAAKDNSADFDAKELFLCTSIELNVSFTSVVKYKVTVSGGMNLNNLNPLFEQSEKKEASSFNFFLKQPTLCRFVKVTIKLDAENTTAQNCSLECHARGWKIDVEKDLGSIESLYRRLEKTLPQFGQTLSEKQNTLTTELETFHVTRATKLLSSLHKECIEAQADYYFARLFVKNFQALSPTEMNRVASSEKAEVTELTAPTNKLVDESDRILCFTRLFLHLLHQTKSEIDKTNPAKSAHVDWPTAKLLFDRLCVNAPSDIRDSASSWLTHVLDQANDQWVPNLLQQYFSEKNEEHSFNQTQLLELLVKMIKEEHQNSIAHQVFAMLEQTIKPATNSKEGFKGINIASISWMLLLLSKIVSFGHKTKSVHQNSMCNNCGMSPISGTRYRCANCVNVDLCERCEQKAVDIHDSDHVFLKIRSPLPLPPSVTEQQDKESAQLQGPLLANLYKADEAAPMHKLKKSHSSEKFAAGYIHHVECARCGSKQITGIRYKCCNCQDYDLCADCESKEKHFPLHVFLKIRKPLPPKPVENANESSLPKPLIPNQALIPLVLHRGLYPTKQPLIKDITNTPKSSSTSSTPLTVIFSFLCAAIKESNTKSAPKTSDTENSTDETLLLAMNILKKVVRQYTFQEVRDSIVTRPEFTTFFNDVLACPSPFVQNTFLELFETIFDTKTYSETKSGTTAENDIVLAKYALRPSIITMLQQKGQATRKDMTAIEFLLEVVDILLVKSTSTPKSASTSHATIDSNLSQAEETTDLSWRTRSAPLPKQLAQQSKLSEISSEFPVDTQLLNFLLNFILALGLSDETVGCWWHIISLFKHSSPQKVSESKQFSKIIETLLVASEDLQSLLQDVVNDILSWLLSSNVSGPNLKTYVLSKVIEVLPSLIACTETKGQPLAMSSNKLLIYSSFVNLLFSKPEVSFNLPITPAQLFSILENIATVVVNEKQSALNVDVVIPPPTSLATNQLLIKYIASVFTTGLGKPKEPNPTITKLANELLQMLLDQIGSKSGSHVLKTLIEWLGKQSTLQVQKKAAETNNANSPKSFLDPFRKSFKSSVLKLVFVLCENQEVSKQVLALCCDMLATDNFSMSLVQLCKKLTTNDTLVKYLLLEKGGFAQLTQFLLKHNANKTVAHSDLSTAILSQLYASTSVTTTDDDNVPTTSSYKLTKIGQLEEFGPVSEVLVADGNLANTLKESASSNSYVWTKKPSVPGGDTSFSIKFPFSVVLSEIVLTVYKNWYVDNDPSEFPTRVAFFVGNSPQKQKKPLGRFQFSESYATGTGNSQLQSFKFPIAASLKTVSKYITLKFTFDGNKPIAITRVQLRGVSVGNYNYSSQSGITVSSSLMTGIGDLLSHCVQFAEVQKQLSQQFLTDASLLKSTLVLLNNVTSETQSAIEDTLFFLAKGNDKLLPTLFDSLLNEKMSSFQAQLVARLLCGAPVSPDKLLEVKSYVFSALQSSQTIPVVMLPLMSALSFSVSKLRSTKEPSTLQKDLALLSEAQLLVLYNHCVNNLEGTQSFEQSLRLLSAFVQTNASYYQTIVTNFQKSQASILEDAKSKTLLDSKSLRIVSNLASASLACGEIVLKTDLITAFAKKLTGLLKEAIGSYKDFQRDEPYIQQLFSFFGDASYNAVLREWQSQTLVPDLLNVLHKLIQDPDKLDKKTLISAITKQLTQSARLNLRSQQQLGDFVVTVIQECVKAQKVKKDTSMEAELKVVESILSMENTVGFCANNLHAKADYGGSNNVKMALEFDTTNVSSAVVDGSSAKITQNNYIYVTLRATVGWSTGYHYFEVEINGSTNNIFIGVVEASHAINTYTGQWHASNFSVGLMGSSSPWLYISNNSNGGKQWGTQFGKGDFIGVAVDFTEYTIEYFKNGESLGIAYSSDSNPSFEGKTLYPAITLYAPGDEVTLIGHGKSPMAFGSDHAPAKAVKGGSELLETVGAECPLRYHRTNPVYVLNVETPLSTLNDSLQVGLAKGQDSRVQYFAGNQQISESTTPLHLLQMAVTGNNNNVLLPAIVDAEFTFGKETANVPVPPKPENAVFAVNRVIELVVEKNALGFLLESLTSSIGEIVSQEVEKQNAKSVFDSAANPTLECLLVWSKWFDWLQVLSQLDGFSRAFLNSKRCKNFLFTALRGDFLPKPKKDGTPTKELSDERAAEMFEPLMDCVLQLMKATGGQEKQAIALRQQVAKIHLLERCLLYISECSGIESRSQNTEIKYSEAITSIKQSYEKHKAKVKEHEDEKKKNSKTFWAKGTGYGTSHDAQTDWDHVSYTKTVIAKAKQIALFTNLVNEFLSVSPEVMNDPVKSKLFFPENLLAVLENSCLVPTLISYFRNDSILELMRQKELYETLFKLTRTLSSNPTLLTLFDSLPNESTSIKSLLRKLNGMAELLITTSKKAAKINKTTDSEPTAQTTASSSVEATGGEAVPELEKPAFSQTEELAFAKTIIDLHKFVSDSLAEQEKRKAQTKDSESDAKSDKPKLSDYDQLFAQYKELLETFQFGERPMADEEGNYTHHYSSRIASEAIGASSNKLKRLVQELSSLATGLPMSLESSVFLRVDEERPDVMQALITGPAATPYSNGCFQFDIYCPNDYPKVPPQVNLETTGNGTVRFNPNLYNCGKVCLSLLGTWSGAQNEQWNEKTSTILQVLVSIQSLIFVEKPYFNEPGYENSMNTPQGDKSNKEYNQNIRLQTARWAMVDQLRKPSAGFEEVIRNHFKLKKDIVIKELEQWVKESPTGQVQAMQEQLDAFKKEVEKLSNSNRND